MLNPNSIRRAVCLRIRAQQDPEAALHDPQNKEKPVCFYCIKVLVERCATCIETDPAGEFGCPTQRGACGRVLHSHCLEQHSEREHNDNCPACENPWS